MGSVGATTPLIMLFVGEVSQSWSMSYNRIMSVADGDPPQVPLLLLPDSSGSVSVSPSTSESGFVTIIHVTVIVSFITTRGSTEFLVSSAGGFSEQWAPTPHGPHRLSKNDTEKMRKSVTFKHPCLYNSVRSTLVYGHDHPKNTYQRPNPTHHPRSRPARVQRNSSAPQALPDVPAPLLRHRQ